MPNIPMDMAIDCINEKWTYISNNCDISQIEFIKAITFILDSTYFTFDNIIYKQNFGTPMGSPLSPIVADLVMRRLERTALMLYKSYKFNRNNIKVAYYSSNKLRKYTDSGDLYRKPTFSGRFLNFLSNHPISQKRGVIYSLVDRAFLLSDVVFHEKNLILIINILLDNDYPLSFIFDTINQRIKLL
ncbi:hypothetical protein ALC62_10773 [Cyphomyrmex costatus]|uniref:Helix-turn-helix domain-containing protein n=1 Tax=Cyphomyrmex costatus TaxID=456900 RepID=A0A151IDF3_9HYME|nr:hypothetical protein ALC62_10773 [Cyphomyrmex costatus]